MQHIILALSDCSSCNLQESFTVLFIFSFIKKNNQSESILGQLCDYTTILFLLHVNQKRSRLCEPVMQIFFSMQDLTKDVDGDEQSLSNAKVMCRLCFSGESERSERAKRMLSCENCNKKYHKGCVKSWAQNRGWTSCCPNYGHNV